MNSSTVERLFVSCAPKLELLLQEELKALGIVNVSLGSRGVFVPHTWENIFKVNYLSRLATRVLLPIAQFACSDADALYYETGQITWLNYLNAEKTLSIDANVQHPLIRHSLYASQRVKDAICDQLRAATGARPSVDTKNPDLQLNLFIHNKRATLSIDTSGSPLHKRGWRTQSGEASLPATLAAAILIHSGYKATEVLCDPCCGSGTFLIEAASMATNTPAGYFREKWGFTSLPLFQEEQWQTFKAECDSKIIPLKPGSLMGADKDNSALSLCKEHLKKAGFDKEVLLFSSPMSTLRLPCSPTLVVCNPPFGKRLETSPLLYEEWGAFLKRECPVAPWGYLLACSYSLVKATKCSVLSEWPLEHGGLHVSLYQLKS